MFFVFCARIFLNHNIGPGLPQGLLLDVDDRVHAPGVDLMKQFRTQFTDKTYLVKFKCVFINLYGFKVP
jgi:hypothetical protein